MAITPEIPMIDTFNPYILLIGDSLTEYSFNPELSGWGAVLESSLDMKYDVINRGFSGYTSYFMVNYMQLLFKEVKNFPKLIIIMLGTNDCVPYDHSKQQYVPLEDFERYYLQIVEYIQSLIKDANIICVSFPPIDYMKLSEKRDHVFDNSTREQYVKSIEIVVEKTKVNYLDIFHKMINERNGVHLSKEGNIYLGDMLVEYIKYSHNTIIEAINS